MKRALMPRLESVAVAIGAVFMSLALAAVDWRMGLFALGLAIAASAVDLPWRRG